MRWLLVLLYTCCWVGLQGQSLDLIQQLPDKQGGIPDLVHAHAMAISPDGRHLYLAGKQLAIYKRDSVSGLLTYQEAHELLESPWEMVISPDGRNIYLTSGRGSGFEVLHRDSATGSVNSIQFFNQNPWNQDVDVVTELDLLEDLQISGDGRHVYVAVDDSDDIVLFHRDANTGMLRQGKSFDFAFGLGSSWDKYNIGDLMLTPDDRFLYITHDRGHRITCFQRDATSGELTLVQHITQNEGRVRGMFSPNSMVMTPRGDRLYVTAYDSKSVNQFHRNVETGELEYFRSFRDRWGHRLGLSIAPDGRFLLLEDPILNKDSLYRLRSDMALVCLDPYNGALRNKKEFKFPIKPEVLSTYVWSPDGRFVYLTGSYDGVISVLHCTPEASKCFPPLEPEPETEPEPEPIPIVQQDTTLMPDTVANRVVKEPTVVEVHQQSFTIALYDNRAVDGDTISVWVNDELVADQVALRKQKKALELSITLDASRTENFLLMHAHNLGEIPPNTAALKITAGEHVQVVKVSSNLEQSGAVVFKYVPAPANDPAEAD